MITTPSLPLSLTFNVANTSRPSFFRFYTEISVRFQPPPFSFIPSCFVFWPRVGERLFSQHPFVVVAVVAVVIVVVIVGRYPEVHSLFPIQASVLLPIHLGWPTQRVCF
ncbi:hypothetical protein LX36DRAFT_455222 [Colletotrichum falcatum]|nr:hypothetical protein LX36DRAFT_455222 [Colletotrichum falcatum]